MDFQENPRDTSDPNADALVDMVATATNLSGAEKEFAYKDLLNALPVAIYTTDRLGRITFYNEAAIAFSGRRPTLGSDEWCVTWRLYHLDGRPMPHDQCPMAVALRENREIRGVEAIAERPDGSRIIFEPYPTPIRNAAGDVVGGINMLVDVTERNKTAERQQLLLHEVNHRANNLLTVIQSFVALIKTPDVASYRDALNGRLQSLARAHSVLSKNQWKGADLAQLITEELAPYMQSGNNSILLQGAAIPLAPTATQPIAMVIHELATNAVKYGALSVSDGRLTVQWRLTGGDITLSWVESRGSKTQQPANSGLGTSIMDRCISQLGGMLSRQWRPEGLSIRICWPSQSPTEDARG